MTAGADLAAALRAEQAGDVQAAMIALHAHLAVQPADHLSRLRLARLLVSVGDLDAACRHAIFLAEQDDPAVVAPAYVLLAEIDEVEGRLTAAALRWERVLAYDIDHARARARLRALGSDEAPFAVAADAGAATFVSPEGVHASRYRLLRELGRGATSAVYLAQDQSLGIDVALKVLHPHIAAPARSEGRRRFFSEARTAAALRHPGVVAVYDLDEATRVLTMEYIPGGTLRERLRTAHPDAREVIATARGLLGALAYVHERGIVHGDVKPSNLLLRRPGEAVLGDFGVARLTEALESAADVPAGTPLYFAPEQFRGAPSSPFTDLYAAGAILWEMAAGRPLRDRPDLGARSTTPPLPPPAVTTLGGAAHALADIIDRLAASDPARRLPSAGVALRLLAEAASAL